MKFTKAAGATISSVAPLSQAEMYGSPNAFGTPVRQQTLDAEMAQGMTTLTPFSPGGPINPRRPEGESPIQWAYIIGQNIVQQPRSTEMVSFEAIDGILESYDIAKLCRKVRIDQIRSMDWHIIPYDMGQYKARQSDIKKAEMFFDKPYSGALFSDFLAMIEHDRISYDAMCFFKQHSRDGKLGALEPVDGRTITPIVDFYGHPPLPPAPAYVQFVRGIPEVWLTRDTLVYRPWYKNSKSAYGSPPVVKVLMNANTDVRMYLYFLGYFTDGNIPAAYMNAPADMIDPKQIKEFQDLYDVTMDGVQEQKRRLHVIPAGSQVKEMREYSPNTDFSKYLMTITCSAFDVVPSELGFTENTNKSSGDSQENVQMRRSQKPTIKFYNEIFTDILHNDLGMPDLKMELVLNNKDEDQLMDAERHQIFVNIGMESREEAALAVFGHAPTDGVDSGRTVLLANQIIKIEDVANGVMGQGEVSGGNPTPPPSQGAQKAAADSLKKNMNFRHKVENKLAASFQSGVSGALSRQGKAMSGWALKCAESLGKADSTSDPLEDMILTIVNSQGWDAELTEILTANIVQIFASSMRSTQQEQGIELPEQLDADGEPVSAEDIFQQAADEYAQGHIGDLITGLDQTTHDMIQGTLHSAIEQGMTPHDISDMLQSDYAFSPERAMTIARSETADAWNMGNIGIGEAAGLNAVLVFDGDYDPECAEANGQIWSTGYAKRHTKQHPNCTRDFSPRHAEPEEIDRGDNDK